LEIVTTSLIEPKIEGEDDEYIKGALRYVFLLIGLKTIPEELEKVPLMYHIRTYYGNFTASDIRIAFELAIEGVTGANIEHYDKFSIKYFVGIMRAYKSYKSQVIQKAKILLSPIETAEDLEEKKRKISGEYFCAIVLDLYTVFFKEEKFSLNVGPEIEAVYDSLFDRGFIDEKKKKEIWILNVNAVKSGFNNKKKYANVYDKIKDYKRYETQIEKAILQSKKDLILETFKRWKNEKKENIL